MLDISIRINALIAYLFLGPIMLLAKRESPLADSFVRGHAKRASMIILMGIVAFVFYRLIQSFLLFGIFGISVDAILLGLITSGTILALIAGAYQAYHGIDAHELTWRSFALPENTTYVGSYREEDKVRIVASFIPFIGIIVAHLYPIKETIIGRKIGSLATCILLSSIVFFSGSVTTLTLIFTLMYIGGIVIITVQLFVFSRFLSFRFYENIPSFLEFDAHIKASLVSIFDFFMIAFGKDKHTTYSARFTQYLDINMKTAKAVTPYFMPIWLTIVPGINLIAIPSLWQARYREYLPLILQGLFITVLIGTIGIRSQMGLYLLFPIISLIIESKENILARAPLTSFIVDLLNLFSIGKDKMAEIQVNGEEKVSFSYEIHDKIKDTITNI